jgi:hypothetical protein
MKPILKFATIALLPIIVVSITACFDNGMKGEEEVSVVSTDNGAIIVDTLTVNATVVSKDVAKGKITLASDEGGESTYKVDEDVADISGIDVGDRITAVVTEEIALFVGADLPDTVSAADGVMIAPDGSVEGVVVESMKVTGIVTAVDTKKRKVTFRLQDGSSKTVKVREGLDLSRLPVGETVTVQVGQGFALSIQK